MKVAFIAAILSILMTCKSYSQKDSIHSVGTILFDPALDDPSFRFCSDTYVFQGYELRTKENDTRQQISELLLKRFSFKEEWKNDTGFITVRFAVNCFGITGLFRVKGVNGQLEEETFTASLNKHLLESVKAMKWPQGMYNLQAVDYYHYVIFKIENGKLKAVM